MFTDDKMYITKIHSVIFVKPSDTPKSKMRYGPNIRRHELVFKISGENITHYNGIDMHQTGGFIEFLPKCPQADYTVDIIADGACIDVFFDTDFPMPTEAFCLDCAKNARIAGLFDKIFRLWSQKQDGYYPKCMAVFYEILAEIAKPQGNYLPKDKYKKIEKGIEYLHEHCFDREIDYYAPAALCGISYTYFKRLFAEKFNEAPVRYVNKLRLERSRELLSTGSYTVSEIAQECGFESVYYFSKKFKDAYGVSPTKYKPA